MAVKQEPFLLLEVAWTGAPPSSTAQAFNDIPWENMTDRLLEVPSITEGKSDELGVADAGKMTVILDDHDRYLDSNIGAFDHPMSITADYDMAQNDYAELIAWQGSGGALNVSVTGNYSPEFSMERIGDTSYAGA